jgi:hypothetical protein
MARGKLGIGCADDQEDPPPGGPGGFHQRHCLGAEGLGQYGEEGAEIARGKLRAPAPASAATQARSVPGTLETWLAAEKKLPASERYPARRVHEALRVQGYTGSVDVVRRYMRRFARRRRHTHVLIEQAFAPRGDWSHEAVESWVGWIRWSRSRTRAPAERFFLVVTLRSI